MKIGELLQDLLESVCFILESTHVCLCNKILCNGLAQEDSLMVDHLAGLEEPASIHILHDSIHDEIDEFWLSTRLGNRVAFVEPVSPELLKIL